MIAVSFDEIFHDMVSLMLLAICFLGTYFMSWVCFGFCSARLLLLSLWRFLVQGLCVFIVTFSVQGML